MNARGGLVEGGSEDVTGWIQWTTAEITMSGPGDGVGMRKGPWRQWDNEGIGNQGSYGGDGGTGTKLRPRGFWMGLLVQASLDLLEE